MSNVDGTVQGVQLIAAPSGTGGNRKVYLVTCSFGAYTGSSDTSRVLSVDTAISSHTENGRTVTVRGAQGGPPGRDTNGQAVYTSATITNTSGTLSFDLCGTTTELTSATASSGVGIVVTVDED